MNVPSDAIAAPVPDCRVSVVIPARNEATLLAHALRAFAHQRDAGRSVDPRTFELIVLANNCDDGTAAVAQAFAREHPDLTVHVIAIDVPVEIAHVGTARGMALDLASARFAKNGRSRGIVASTDADSVVGSTWIAATIAEMHRVDAVAGYVTVADSERDLMLAPVRLLYDREVEYRRLLGVIEAKRDPQSFDPGPRHDAFVGASFAVTASTYARSGGLPRLARLEDLAFAWALQRIDARVRHSYTVRVATSARRAARVEGGFGTFISDLELRAGARISYPVRSARAALEEARARALLRAGRLTGTRDPAFIAAADLLGLPAAELRSRAATHSTFGSYWLEIEPRTRQARYPEEPVEAAIAQLRRAIAEHVVAPAQPLRNAETG